MRETKKIGPLAQEFAPAAERLFALEKQMKAGEIATLSEEETIKLALRDTYGDVELPGAARQALWDHIGVRLQDEDWIINGENRYNWRHFAHDCEHFLLFKKLSKEQKRDKSLIDEEQCRQWLLDEYDERVNIVFGAQSCER